MRTFSSINDESHLFFVTSAICGWKQLFKNPVYAKIVLGSLEWLRNENRMKLYAYVLMPSHLHAVVKPTNCSIGALLQKFGSFTAHTILKQLRNDGRTDLIKFFHENRRDKRHEHSIWQDIQAKNIYTRKFLLQKLEYIHNNPVSKDPEMSSDRTEYLYSSAQYYDHDEESIITVDDVREWM